jgi:uncharacterized protein YndB with AHSA1/START domain
MSINNNLIVSKSIEINAEPSKVWKALTDPEIIREYLFGTETITDWNIGSDVIFQGEYNGHKYKDKGVVRENIINQVLSYTYWSGFSGLEDKPENYSLVKYTLAAAGGKTKLTWTQTGFANEEGHKHSENGMAEFLKGIKIIIER